MPTSTRWTRSCSAIVGAKSIPAIVAQAGAEKLLTAFYGPIGAELPSTLFRSICPQGTGVVEIPVLYPQPGKRFNADHQCAHNPKAGPDAADLAFRPRDIGFCCHVVHLAFEARDALRGIGVRCHCAHPFISGNCRCRVRGPERPQVLRIFYREPTAQPCGHDERQLVLASAGAAKLPVRTAAGLECRAVAPEGLCQLVVSDQGEGAVDAARVVARADCLLSQSSQNSAHLLYFGM